MDKIKSLIKRLLRRCGVIDIKYVSDIKLERVVLNNDGSLRGKNILITGGSSGIGLAIARKCLLCGASNVVVTGRNKSKLSACVAEIGDERVKSLVWDVSNDLGLEDGFKQAVALLDGRIDIVVNNAGIAPREKVGEFNLNTWHQVIDVDLIAPTFISQFACRQWLERGVPGVILNISSFASVENSADAYATAKCALNNVTRGMAKRYARMGIRINAIAPGVIVGTDIKELQRSVDPYGNLRCDWIPQGRYGTPEEIAELAVFMISERSAYMTGNVMFSDGGGFLR